MFAIERASSFEFFKENKVTIRFVMTLFFCLLFFGCAFDVYHLSSTPTRFSREIEASPKSFILKEEVLINEAPCGYRRMLRAGSRWEQCGTISQGDVYKSRDQVLTVECSNIYEAYLVMSNGKLCGFYLPIEKAYVSLPTGMNLPLK
jgi:hypothetical protein